MFRLALVLSKKCLVNSSASFKSEMRLVWLLIKSFQAQDLTSVPVGSFYLLKLLSFFILMVAGYWSYICSSVPSEAHFGWVSSHDIKAN